MDNLERARTELRAAERDFERNVRWLGAALGLCVLSWVNLLAQRLHWLPIWLTVPGAVLIGLATLLVLGPVVRWMWANRPGRRRR